MKEHITEGAERHFVSSQSHKMEHEWNGQGDKLERNKHSSLTHKMP